MTINEIGNYRLWLEHLAKETEDFGKVNVVIRNSAGDYTITLGELTIFIVVFDTLESRLFVDDKMRYTLFFLSNEVNGLFNSDGLCDFYKDTDGVKIFLKLISEAPRENGPLDDEAVVLLVYEAETTYKNVYRGKLAGNRFGF